MKAICSANALIELSDEKKQTINKTVVFSSLCVVFSSPALPLCPGVVWRIVFCVVSDKLQSGTMTMISHYNN